MRKRPGLAVVALLAAGCTSAPVHPHSVMHPAVPTTSSCGGVLGALGDCPRGTPTTAIPTTTTTLPSLPLYSASAAAKFTDFSPCSFRPDPGAPGDDRPSTKGSVTTPPEATQEAGEVEMQVLDSSGTVLGTGNPFTLNGGPGSYFVTLDADFPEASHPAECLLIWLAPPSTGSQSQPPPIPTTTPTPTTYPVLP